MSGRAKFWWTLAAVSVIVNGGGAVFALFNREWMHGGIHVAALAITVYLVQIFRPRARRSGDDSAWVDDEGVEPVQSGDARMQQLQQSVDAIAVEVERIGEAQRRSAKMAAKPGEESGERR